MVSFYLIFSTAKSDGVFDQPFYDTFSKMNSDIAFFYCSKLFWILWQTNLFLFHYVSPVDYSLSQLLSSSLQELDLSLPLSKKWSAGDTLPNYVFTGFNQLSYADFH